MHEYIGKLKNIKRMLRLQENPINIKEEIKFLKIEIKMVKKP